MERRIIQRLKSLIAQSESDSASSSEFLDLLTAYFETRRELSGCASHGTDPSEFLKQLASERENQTQAKTLPANEVADILERRFDLLAIKHDFKAGDLVRWKQGLKNKRSPLYDQPAIVIDVLERPLRDTESDAGSPYFGESLDLVLGVLVDMEFLMYHFDKRRFEPFPKKLTT